MTAAPEPDAEESVTSRGRLVNQLAKWREDLLQIDKRQRLVYFKHSRSASLEIDIPELAALVQSVSARAVSFRAVEEMDADVLRGARDLAVVVTNKTGAELDRGLKRLAQLSSQTLADRGFWNLYLGVGMLEWTDEAGLPVSSPLLLIPIRLERSAAAQRYRMRRTAEELAINPALGLKLEHDHQVVPPGVDAFDVDVEDYLDEMRKTATAAGKPWTVSNRVVLTTFSFHKEAIYRDLRDNADTVLDSALVELLALGPDALSAGEWGFVPAQGDLDEVFPPEQLHTILDADATQRRCILAARDGHSFVMDGPPGTGKSQTIANAIAELMTAGKTVLFVSEKAAALDVVRNRLRERGLDPFLLELHDVNTTRKHVATVLADALTKRPYAPRLFTSSDASALRALRQETTGHSHAMNEHRANLGTTLSAVIGRLTELDQAPDLPALTPERARQLDADSLSRAREGAGALERSWRPVAEGDSFVWSGLDVSRSLRSARSELPDIGHAAARAAAALVSRLDASDEDLGLVSSGTLESVRARETLLGLVRYGRRGPAHWLTTLDLEPVRRCLAETQQETGALSVLIGEVESRAGDSWRQLNPDRAADVRALLDPHEHSAGFRGDQSSADLARLKSLLMSTPGLLVRLREDVDHLAHLLGIDGGRVGLSRALDLAAIAQVRRSAALPEGTWFDPSVQGQLDRSAAVLGQAVDLVVQQQRALAEVFTPQVLSLDLQGLAYRFREVHTGLRRWSGECRADKRVLKDVSVSGRVDDRLLSSLDAALGWKQAEDHLTRDEQELAPVLGSYYRRTDTDFTTLSEAIASAHRVVRLAGEDLNRTVLGRQLGTGAVTDPALLTIADRVQQVLSGWLASLRPLVNDAEFSMVAGATVLDAAEWCRLVLDRRTPGFDAVEHVAGVVGRTVGIAEALELLEDTAQITEGLARLDEHDEATRTLLGPGYRQRETAWGSLSEDLKWADTVRTAVGGPLPPFTAERLAAPSLGMADITAAADAWMAAVGRLTARFSPSRAPDLPSELETSLRGAVEQLDHMVRVAARDIDDWYALAEALATMDRLGLGAQADVLRDRGTPADLIGPSIEAVLLRSWVDVVQQDDAARLGTYRSRDRQNAVDRFSERDAAQVNEAYSGVVAACSARRPTSALSRAAGLLQRQGHIKSRHKPIRELLDETFPLVAELKPCFMMSPITVSQFIPPTAVFDVVIFDEASQVVPADAINCVYRGRQLIVAGDQKQLPPTSFFQRTGEEADDEETDDFDSLLDLCKGAGGLQSLPLEWHYRSRHEDLIAFSNHRFYGGALETFPGAASAAPDLGVVAFTVPGIYARGGSADNPVEARAVVDRVLAHRRDHPTLSIGVVTLSSSQAEAVSDALEQRALGEPLIDELLTNQGRLDGFFVKNLENVQGDERDIIILSIGYGPDALGRLSANFGPINRPAGWRRLNVAVTRARRRVEVVKSFSAADLGTSPTVPVGHLQAYLRFAETQQVESAVDTAGDRPVSDSGGLQDSVAQAIRDMGHEVVTDVGTAGYRVAVAVRRPGHDDQFALAVELDGAVYDAAQTARDRDRLRTSVLHGLGWRTHRVWGAAWLADRPQEIDRLKRAIEEAVDVSSEEAIDASSSAPSSTDTVTPRAPEPLVELETMVPAGVQPEWATPYVRVRTGVPRHSDPTSIDARPRLREHLTKIIDQEAPIHEDVLLATLRSEWGVGRVTLALRANAGYALRGVRIEGDQVVRDTHDFYRIEGRNVTGVNTPTAEVERTASQVPPEEMDLAMVLTVTDAGMLSEEELKTRVARLFGWSRQGSEIQAALRASLLRVIQMSRLVKTGHNDLRIPRE